MNLAAGIAAALIAGCMNGLFPLPMKAIKGWEWENIWLPFSFLSLAVFPWCVVWATIPDPSASVLHSQFIDLVFLFLCGVLVYTGSLLFGISLVYIGVALSFALLIGTMTVVGVLAPVLLAGHSLLHSRGGALILAGVALAIASVFLGALAGRRKQPKAEAAQSSNGVSSKNISRGSVLAIVGGALSGLLPAGMAMPWAHRVIDSAIQFGSAPISRAPNMALAIVLLGGALPNCGYCIYLLLRNSSYHRYREHARPAYWLSVLAMGVLYSASVALWGVATSPALLGVLGVSVGWALFVGMIVLSSTAAGWLAGEWRSAARSSVTLLASSVTALIGAMVLISLGTYAG